MSDTTTTKRKPTKPRGPKKSGSKLWREIADPKKYELRPDELRILEDACREADLIDQLEDALEGQPFIVTGSQGQDVINPLIPEIRQHRATLTSMMLKLKLSRRHRRRDDGFVIDTIDRRPHCGSVALGQASMRRLLVFHTRRYACTARVQCQCGAPEWTVRHAVIAGAARDTVSC